MRGKSAGGRHVAVGSLVFCVKILIEFLKNVLHCARAQVPPPMWKQLSSIRSPLGSESKNRWEKKNRKSFKNERVKNRIIHSQVCIKGFTGILRSGQIARGSSTSWGNLSKRWLNQTIDPESCARRPLLPWIRLFSARPLALLLLCET